MPRSGKGGGRREISDADLQRQPLFHSERMEKEGQEIRNCLTGKKNKVDNKCCHR